MGNETIQHLGNIPIPVMEAMLQERVKLRQKVQETEDRAEGFAPGYRRTVQETNRSGQPIREIETAAIPLTFLDDNKDLRDGLEAMIQRHSGKLK